VGYFYHGVYHTLVVAPATSNIVAKFPELETRSPDRIVKVFPRRIDLENFEKLKSFEATQVAESLSELKAFVAQRRSDLTVA